MDVREESYTHCDQCIRQCPVTALRCENGIRRYREMTGQEYRKPVEGSREESAYRRRIRERRQRNP